jgi:adenine-specific DNA-methyltransferase
VGMTLGALKTLTWRIRVEKLKMKSQDLSQENILKLRELFPNCVTEFIDPLTNSVSLGVDFEQLSQELSSGLIEGGVEKYSFTWPDKRAAIHSSNTCTSMTLRPFESASVDFEKTQNLYIEGDNLDVLKILRESYLNRIKLIYIDPPYNTGKDFVYNDNFIDSYESFAESCQIRDEDGNLLYTPKTNEETNGRFHTDWLNMMYPRLRIARDLLTNDGMIFISIDDHEVENLKKICQEIFGENNFVSQFVWEKKKKPSFLNTNLGTKTEYILVYAKNRAFTGPLSVDLTEVGKKYPINNAGNAMSCLTFPAESVSFRLPDGVIKAQDMSEGNIKTELLNDVEIKNGKNINAFTLKGEWRYSQKSLDEYIKAKDEITISKVPFRPNHVKKGGEIKKIHNLLLMSNGIGTNEDASEELKKLFGYKVFDYAKPVSLLMFLIKSLTYEDKDCIVLDFFSGSSTTAHAVMKLNSLDGGTRKFIMVQLPEVLGKDSEAAKRNYKTICDIGRDRIKRAGKVILEENELRFSNLDTGFRVLKLWDTNLRDVFYHPVSLAQSDLFNSVDNVKSGRAPEDLLFQIMPECGCLFSDPIEKKKILGMNIFVVNNGQLIACFDFGINEEVITKIAKMQPAYFVTRDAAFSRDNVIDNFDQIFQSYSPSTKLRIF